MMIIKNQTTLGALGKIAISVFIMMGAVSNVSAQEPAKNQQDKTEKPYEVNKADVESVDAILNTLYGVISGPAHEMRDWDRFYSLFIDGARLMPQSSNNAQGISVLDPVAYVARAEPFFLENGFYETEIGRKIDRFGNIVQVFSAYESRNKKDDVKPFARGINSIQLLFHDDRWWVVSIYWQGESESLQIPPYYIDK